MPGIIIYGKRWYMKSIVFETLSVYVHKKIDIGYGYIYYGHEHKGSWWRLWRFPLIECIYAKGMGRIVQYIHK